MVKKLRKILLRILSSQSPNITLNSLPIKKLLNLLTYQFLNLLIFLHFFTYRLLRLLSNTLVLINLHLFHHLSQFLKTRLQINININRINWSSSWGCINKRILHHWSLTSTLNSSVFLFLLLFNLSLLILIRLLDSWFLRFNQIYLLVKVII